MRVSSKSLYSGGRSLGAGAAAELLDTETVHDAYCCLRSNCSAQLRRLDNMGEAMGIFLPHLTT